MTSRRPMKFAIIRFPGSNCDIDCHKAVSTRLRQEAVFVWHQNALPDDIDVVILPGGFSYGDALRAGAIARFSPVMKDIARAAERGMPVLGICNGMQVLVEAGLLPGAMLPNAHGQFICEDVWLRVETTDTPFTHGLQVGQVLKMPVAHGEGRWAGEAGQATRLAVFRYCTAAGEVTEEANPNGSLLNLAGLRNERGNVVGLMPHPERACDPLLGSTHGLLLLQNIVSGVRV